MQCGGEGLCGTPWVRLSAQNRVPTSGTACWLTLPPQKPVSVRPTVIAMRGDGGSPATSGTVGDDRVCETGGDGARLTALSIRGEDNALRSATGPRQTAGSTNDPELGEDAVWDQGAHHANGSARPTARPDQRLGVLPSAVDGRRGPLGTPKLFPDPLLATPTSTQNVREL